MNQREVFFEKRARLMTQRFFELEYIKRHFFISYSEQLLNCMPAIQFLLNAVYAKKQGEQALFFDNLELDIAMRVDLELKKTLEFKSNEWPFVQCSDAKIEYINVLALEIFSRRAFNCPFSALIQPADMRRVYMNTIEGKFKYDTPAKLYITGKNAEDAMLYSAVFAYCLTEYGDGSDSKNIHKEFMDSEMPDILADNYSPEKRILLDALHRCQEGRNMTETEWNVINKAIDERIIADFDVSRTDSRALGLLYFDWSIAANAVGANDKIDRFMDFISEECCFKISKKCNNKSKIKRKPVYPESDKRKFRDALRLASLCIAKKKILPVITKGEKDIPAVVPVYSLYYDELIQWHKKN